MDKSGIIQEHSKIKLELYRLYLERYLSVLLVTPFFEGIDVIDLFAGSGISENAEKGSAVIAAETIEAVSKNHNTHRKVIALKLNDARTQYYESLQKHLSAYSFASPTNKDANDYVKAWAPTPKHHHLFFIDPHGYTQIDAVNLTRLFTTQNCDFLIFIPIFHIYRFIKPSNQPKAAEQDVDLFGERKKKPDGDKYYEPVARFLEGLGIEKAAIEVTNSVEEFTDVIYTTLGKISGSGFVYCQILQNSSSANKYALFFVSHHIRGAEKFLDAQHELRVKTNQASGQQSLFDFVSASNPDSLLNFLKYDEWYDNVQLFELAINAGTRPAELRTQLLAYEKDGKLEVKELAGKKRNRGGLYLVFKHYNQKDRIVTVRLRRT